MQSIIPHYLRDGVYDPIGLPQEDHRKGTMPFLGLVKFFATNAKKALQAFNKGNLSLFDPLVRDRYCQTHTERILDLYGSADVRSETIPLSERVQKVLMQVNRLTSKPPTMDEKTTLAQFEERHAMRLEVSPEVNLLFLAHLLTIACSYGMTRSGEVSYQTNYDLLRTKLSKSVDNKTIAVIVNYARTIFSASSMQFIRELGGAFTAQLAERLSVVKSIQMEEMQLSASCAFYHMQTILLRAKRDQRLMLVREFRRDQERPFGLYFRANSRGGEFGVVASEGLVGTEPVYVIEAMMAAGADKEGVAQAIQQHILTELILCGAASVNQYTVDDDISSLDEEAQTEIRHYREKGEVLGCTPQKLTLFFIVHVRPSIVLNEKVR